MSENKDKVKPNSAENELTLDAESEAMPIPVKNSNRDEEEHSEGTEDGKLSSSRNSTPLSPSTTEQSMTSKRQKISTPSTPQMVSASPPGFITLEEIMKAANSVSKMALAHEIAVDEDFHLEKVNPPDNSIEKKIKDIAFQAFWDLLKEELQEDPPQYKRALVLLEEVKDWLLSLLLPHQTKTQQEIKEKLDIDLIKQQIEAGTLDLHSYSDYIISLMARLCAPGRDDKIRELTMLRDLVPLYKGIFETLELMKIDMANFTIRLSRPHIAACSVEYERSKFEDYLKVTPDGLRNTREWLHRHRRSASTPDSPSSSTTPNSTVISLILVDAFMELLNWNESFPWPETLALDEQRFIELRHTIKFIEISSSMLLIAISHSPSSLQSSPEYRTSLKEHITILLGTTKSPELEDVALTNAATQVVEDMNKALKGQGSAELTEDSKRSITTEMTDLRNPDSRIRQILHGRLMDFLRQVISHEVARPTQIPSGLSLFKNEIAAVAGRFARLISHNRSVFAHHYATLIQNHCID